ncbi:hypothetical protein R5R35_012756 [Gryllus longicercus]|uniref:PID domain-containing protein n=1 Tax=Gryllus longicercus TaxID=2509291 RepID=A0AAN9ZD10_9ORTH
MKLTVCNAGLKAVTKEHGLTEYWSHRITYCAAPSSFPRVFCWVYRHEGRKLKQELRCHAVLCSKEAVARRMASQLRAKLALALSEFKRDKVCRQNARLSLANSVYDNPSLPRRKILLSTGSHNYRPPLERSKSAPKLMVIEESLEEEEEEQQEQLQQQDEHGGQEARRQAGDEEVQRLAERLAAAPSDDVRLPDSASGRDYQQVVTRLAEHQENMQGEQQVALGAHPERRSSLGAGRRGSLPKRISWGPDVEALCEGGGAERLLVAGGGDDAAPDSDEGTSSLQSVSSASSEGSDGRPRWFRDDALGSSFRPLADFREPFPSLPYECNAPAPVLPPPQPPSPGAEVLVDWRPAAGAAPGAAHREAAEGHQRPPLAVVLRRSHTFPPPAALAVEALELDSLSEEDDPLEEPADPADRHAKMAADEDNVSDESGYAELIDNGNGGGGGGGSGGGGGGVGGGCASSRDDCLKCPLQDAVPTTRCVRV